MMKKRIIQVMVALCLILTLMPMSAKAAEPSLVGKLEGSAYCNVQVKNPPDTDYCLAFVFYDENGRYTRAELFENLEGNNVKFLNGEHYAKAYLLHPETYEPYCEAVKVKRYLKVCFYSDGNLIGTKNVINEISSKYGKLPALPNKGEDIELLGWYKEDGTKVTETTFINSRTDISLYARWGRTEYEVSFYDGGELFKTITVKQGDAYGTLPDPGTKDGYEFLGWYTAAVDGTKVKETDKPSGEEDISLYARWRKAKYLVSFYDGDELVETRTLNRGNSYGTLPVPKQREGYEFLGWYTDTEAGTMVKDTTKVAGEEDIDLYARWKKLNFTVSFYDGEELIASIPITLGEKYGELPVPEERDGFYFLGWFTAAEGGEQITAATKVTTETNVTLYAQWKELKEIPVEAVTLKEADNTFDYSQGSGHVPVGRNAKITFVAVDGANYPNKGYEFKYKVHGSNEYLEGKPSAVGSYDVIVTRAADKTYAAFEHIYENALVINRNKINDPSWFANIILTNRGYTWFELEVEPYGYGTITEGANVTFAVSADQKTWYYGEVNSNVVRVPEYLGCDWWVSVKVTDDPNYEDWSCRWQYYLNNDKYPYHLAPLPTTSWKENTDTSWFTAGEGVEEYTITTAAQLAGLAQLVNEGNNFAGITVKLGNDIDLVGHQWMPIGKSDYPFCGTFDGQGYSISNLYLSDNYAYSGLFGYTADVYLNKVVYAEIKNLNLQYSQIACGKSTEYAGGIVARATYTIIENCSSDTMVSANANKENTSVGGIVGIGEGVQIKNCVNYGNVESMGNGGGIAGKLTQGESSVALIDSCVIYDTITSPRDSNGGIVGLATGNTVTVNCINYGQVSTDVSTAVGFGGIIGHVVSGEVYNCVNFGPVTGYNTVGGIVGLNETADCELYNCYNVGSVRGKSRSYIGAVIGRNQKNAGTVKYCYYQAGSAKYSSGGDVSGAGTKDSSTDSVDNLDIGYFTVSKDWVMNVHGHWYGGDQSAVSGGTLIDVLNRWQSDNVNKYNLAKWWKATPDGYPIPDITAW